MAAAGFGLGGIAQLPDFDKQFSSAQLDVGAGVMDKL